MDYRHGIHRVALFLVSFITVSSLDHTGRRFIVAFFRNLDVRQFDAYVLITPVTNVNTTASIFYVHQEGRRPLFLSLSSKNVTQIRLQSDRPRTSYLSYPVLKINASHPVTVTAVVEGATSFSSYLVYPLDVAGQEFRMVPFCNASTESLCVCDIVTIQTNTNITLENINNGNISIYTQKHAVGDDTVSYLSLPHSKTHISWSQHLGFISLESNDDFSGLLLRTNHPVVVFCGGKKNDEAMTMEQILPVIHFDRDFHSFPFDKTVMPSPSLRFISHFNCTTVAINSKQSWTLDAGQFRDEPIQSSDIWTIFSNKPIGLFQIFAGTSPSREHQSHYEEDMVMVPSVPQYVSSVIIPRRKKTSNTEFRMYIGLVSEVMYSIETPSGTSNRTAMSTKVIRESDADGEFLTMNQISSKACRDSERKLFGAYTYRLSEADASFSNVGVKFVLKPSKTYEGEPCTKAGSNPALPSGRTTTSTTTTTAAPATTEIHISTTTSILENKDTTAEHYGEERTFSEFTNFLFDTTDDMSIPTVQCTCQPCNQLSTITSTTASATTTINDKVLTTTTLADTPTTASTIEDEDPITTLLNDNVASSTTIEDKTPTVTMTAQEQTAATSSSTTTATSSKTEDEIREKIKEIKRALTIDKNDLSSYRRKKTSADDDRSSAKGIGVLGACVICAVISFIIVLDFKTFVHQGEVLWKRTVGSSKRSADTRC